MKVQMNNIDQRRNQMNKLCNQTENNENNFLQFLHFDDQKKKYCIIATVFFFHFHAKTQKGNRKTIFWFLIEIFNHAENYLKEINEMYSFKWGAVCMEDSAKRGEDSTE